MILNYLRSRREYELDLICVKIYLKSIKKHLCRLVTFSFFETTQLGSVTTVLFGQITAANFGQGIEQYLIP